MAESRNHLLTRVGGVIKMRNGNVCQVDCEENKKARRGSRGSLTSSRGEYVLSSSVSRRRAIRA